MTNITRTHWQPAPDALDELCDPVHGIAVMRHDAAHAPLHVHQPPVAARVQQQPALALAVVRQWHLRNSHESSAQSMEQCLGARCRRTNLHRA